MELRRVTELVELEELPQDASIILVDGNEAKRMSAEKAGLGGNSQNPSAQVTVFQRKEKK
jgi:hypothetical protein|nr:MAG TPA_asm: hypothetical protein [Caudoviricetes sp.]